MRNGISRILMVGLFLLVSCSSKPTLPTSLAETAQPTTAIELVPPALTQVTPAMSGSTITPVETTSNKCATEEINQIGQSVADLYPFTTVSEVMTWFCNGAEFEDILMSLETEELNGTAAEEMLEMRAEGLSWDEIWLIIGFVEP